MANKKSRTRKARSRAAKILSVAGELAAARRRLIAAKRQYAAVTRPTDAPSQFEPAWQRTASLLERRGDELLRSRNVLGHTVSFRERGGISTDERCITVFVRKKLSAEDLARTGEAPLPKRMGKGTNSIGIDVVELGPLVRQATGGDSIGPDGRISRGTLGSFAIDDATGSVVAITAMHVTGQKRDIPRAGMARALMRRPGMKDDPDAPLFGAAVLGTMEGVDACKIAPDDPASLDDRIMGIGRIRGWRPVLVPGDKGTGVRMFGTVSGLVSGVIEHPIAALPEFGLTRAILVDIPSRKGDSGAALVDRDKFVLGFLVGMAGKLRVFCPAGDVLRRLECDIPTT